ncbi:MAG: hypothetical protein IIC22_06595 [Chloroflexi bacterium]|nr:hypothetical protein [Chloroflexota bacterium]
MKSSVLAIRQTGVAFGELVVSLLTLLVINIVVLAPAAWMASNILS